MIEARIIPAYAEEQHTISGWHRVSGKHITRPEPVNEWCRKTFAWDDWDRIGYDWWFKREEDAIWFTLKWS